MRYKVVGPWSSEARWGSFVSQSAQIQDTKTGTLYSEGAYRVIDSRTGKPAKKGKGGTVPFFGETAWNDADRLLADLATAEAYA
jgi:hypothetical protein